MKVQKYLAAVLMALVTIAGAATASAASGFISGRMRTWNQNGNYCDAGVQTCTGARYRVADYDVPQVLRNAVVEVWQGSGAIGVGQTDINGDYVVPWSSSSLTNVWVRVFAQHANGAFVINNTTGLRMNNNTPTFTVINGTTAGSPQAIGTFTGGTSASPNWWGNLYWAAEREYRTSINLVGALQTTYNNVEIRGIQQNIPAFLGNCPTSCAVGPQKRIQIDSLVSALSPQARMMHEAGHIASYLLNPYTAMGNTKYCWDQLGATTPTPPATSCTWSMNTPEWAAASFEEAFATFFGDVVLWQVNATVPTSCLSNINCAVNANTRIEQTNWAVNPNTCSVTAANPESRWPLSAERMLWDVYDTVADAPYDTLGEGAGNFWRLFANMTQYGVGINDHDIDEPWQDAARTIIDDRDGRRAADYIWWYANYVSYPVLLDTQASNCGAL